jgi:hypothetical protein
MSQISGKDANNGWITCVPAEYDRILPSNLFAAAVRFRLGVAPAHNLPELCVCQEALTPDHLAGCVRLRRFQHTKRHDSIAKAIARFARKVGMDVQTEPYEGGGGVRPDVHIQTAQGSIYLDVSVVHPQSKSMVNLVMNNRMGPIIKREQEKQSHFANYMGQRPGVKFIPVVLSTYGATGDGAKSVYKLIEHNEDDQSGGHTVSNKKKLVKELKEVVAISLQRGNAEALLYGSIQARNAAQAQRLPRLQNGTARRRLEVATVQRHCAAVLGPAAAQNSLGQVSVTQNLTVDVQERDRSEQLDLGPDD